MSARPRLSTSDYALVTGVLTQRARHTGSGRSRVGCPLCERIRGKADTKQSLYLHADGGWVCFRCGAAGWLPGTGRSAIVARPETRTTFLDGEEWRRPPEGFLPLYEGAGLESLALDLHRAYVAARGIPDTIGRLAHLGGCVSGRCSWSVVAPVLDNRTTPATWSGWVARTIYPPEDPWSPIYREPRGCPKGTFLYRQSILDEESSSPVYVVEGVFDALPLWPDGVAALGKVTGPQFSILRASKRPVVFVPDGDAWRAGDGLALALRAAGVPAGCVRLPPRIDPDEVLPGALRDAAIESLASWVPVEVSTADLL